MADEKLWLTAREAATLVGYKNPSNVSRMARSNKVRTKPDPQHTNWLLYNRKDFIRAFEGMDHSSNRPDSMQSIGFPKFNTYLRLKGDKIVMSDAHCPYFDWVLLEQVLRVKDQFGVGELVLAGDTMDCCAQSGFYNLIKADWEVEKVIAKKLFNKLFQEFDKIYLLTANHELRYLRLLWLSYDPSIVEGDHGERLDIWQGVLGDKIRDHRLKISIYPYCDIGETWRVSHPKDYRKIPLSFARDQFAITMRSQIITHAHMTGWCYAPPGQGAPAGDYYLVDTGVCADPRHFPYKNLKITSHFGWSESFVLLKDEFPFIFVKDHNSPIVQRG
jgi:hypothetical protein